MQNHRKARRRDNLNIIQKTPFTIRSLLNEHRGISLLSSPGGALPALYFFFCAFFDKGRNRVSQNEGLVILSSVLDKVSDAFPDEYSRRERDLEDYLKNWVESKRYMRRAYEDKEYFLYIEPEVERIVKLADDALALKARSFVGTKSTLNYLVTLLREMASEGETNPEERIKNLVQQREEIDQKIREAEEALSRGEFAEPISEREIRERFTSFQSNLSELQVSFSEADEKFREASREVRSKIKDIQACGDPRGDAIGVYLREKGEINSSEQGQSLERFKTFYKEIGDEFAELLEKVLSLPAVRSLGVDAEAIRIRSSWHSSVMSIKKTTTDIRMQLARFLKSSSESAKSGLSASLSSAEAKLLSLARADAPGEENEGSFALVSLPLASSFIALGSARPLSNPEGRRFITQKQLRGADERKVSIKSLYNSSGADREKIKRRMSKRLSGGGPFTIGEFFRETPPEYGLEEILYSILISRKMVSSEDKEKEEQINWLNNRGELMTVNIPEISISGDVPKKPVSPPSFGGTKNN